MLFRIVGLGCLLTVGGLTARAQAPVNLADASFKQRLRAQYLASDTAQAIINLYGQRQGGGAGWISSSALTATQALINGGSTTTVNGTIIDQQGPNGVAILLGIGPFMGYGISKLIRFSNKNLEETLTAYAAGQALPNGIRRRLKPRFFNQPFIQYKAIPVVPAN